MEVRLERFHDRTRVAGFNRESSSLGRGAFSGHGCEPTPPPLNRRVGGPPWWNVNSLAVTPSVPGLQLLVLLCHRSRQLCCELFLNENLFTSSSFTAGSWLVACWPATHDPATLSTDAPAGHTGRRGPPRVMRCSRRTRVPPRPTDPCGIRITSGRAAVLPASRHAPTTTPARAAWLPAPPPPPRRPAAPPPRRSATPPLPPAAPPARPPSPPRRGRRPAPGTLPPSAAGSPAALPPATPPPAAPPPPHPGTASPLAALAGGSGGARGRPQAAGAGVGRGWGGGGWGEASVAGSGGRPSRGPPAARPPRARCRCCPAVLEERVAAWAAWAARGGCGGGGAGGHPRAAGAARGSGY